MKYKELLELTKKHPNPFYTNQPSLKYRAYVESPISANYRNAREDFADTWRNDSIRESKKLK